MPSCGTPPGSNQKVWTRGLSRACRVAQEAVRGGWKAVWLVTSQYKRLRPTNRRCTLNVYLSHVPPFSQRGFQLADCVLTLATYLLRPRKRLPICCSGLFSGLRQQETQYSYCEQHLSSTWQLQKERRSNGIDD